MKDKRKQVPHDEKEALIPLREIFVEPGHFIIGHVTAGHIHVADIVHGGISEVALTGQRPDLWPIPVGVIEAIRRKNGMDDPIEDDLIESDPGQ